MPTSNLAVAPTILAMMAAVPHRRILDVGPGHGKYATLCREYLAGVQRVDAVELWEPYVEPFRLRCLYDGLIVGDIMDVPTEYLRNYDIVLMADVLEHLTHEQGETFLRRCPPRVVVGTPATFFQNPEHVDVPPETHRSVWTADEMRAVRTVEVAEEVIGGIFARFAPLA